MTRLFGRSWRVLVGRLVVEAPLRVGFEVERSSRPGPNTATLKLYNLSRDSQALVEAAAEGLALLEVGYRGERTQVFRGGVLRARAGQQAAPARSERSGFEVVTTIEANDAGVEYRRARVSRSYQPNVSVTTVLRDCAAALGLGAGNIREVEAFAALDGGQSTYPEGTVLAGQAARELTRILRSYGLTWSAQHGTVQVLRRGRALQAQAVLLSSSTGLVGSPEVGTRGRVKATALLSPELWPGRRVRLESERVQATLVVQSVSLEGDTNENDWYAHCQLVPEAAA